MANIRLKKIVLEIVENQLRDNDPPVTTEAYKKLIGAGYSTREAKEKIGAVVLAEIYDVLKENQPYDEEGYGHALEEMVRQSMDFEDTHEILTEWDKWDELVQCGYEAQDNLYDLDNQDDQDNLDVQGTQDIQGARGNAPLDYWWQAWEIFQDIIGQEEKKYSVSGLMEEKDYQYPIDEWLQDFEMELGNSEEHEKRLDFCRSVLDMFDWTYDDDGNFRAAVGEELYETGKPEEGEAWFRNWLKREPHNADAWNIFSWCVQKKEGTEAAYRLIRKEVIGIPCTIHNNLLFRRAGLLAERLELKEDLKWIESQLKSYSDSMEEEMESGDLYNGLYDDFCMPVQKPIVKGKKIYPNDPCPCGSGKKYKKCCGKK